MDEQDLPSKRIFRFGFVCIASSLFFPVFPARFSRPLTQAALPELRSAKKLGRVQPYVPHLSLC